MTVWICNVWKKMKKMKKIWYMSNYYMIEMKRRLKTINMTKAMKYSVMMKKRRANIWNIVLMRENEIKQY